MPAAVTSAQSPLFVPVGSSDARLFGLDVRDRACRIAGKAGLECSGTPAAGRVRRTHGAGGPGQKLERIGLDVKAEVAQNLRAQPIAQANMFESDQASLQPQ